MNKRVVVVTGGGQGIGLGIAKRVFSSGATVAVVDNDGERAMEAAQAIGPGSLGIEGDVTDYAQMSEIAARLSTELGTVTGVVACVGWTPDRPFLETSLDEQQLIINLNYVGALHTARALLPQMIEAARGRIVFIASDAARVGVAGEAIYAGAKAAVIGFAKSLAVEVGRGGITVNVVCPGSTNTPLLRGMFTEEQIEKRVKIHPMRRLGEPEDVAGAVNYFLSEEAGFVSGQVLSVSGGMLRVG